MAHAAVHTTREHRAIAGTKAPSPGSAARPVYNRLATVMTHTTRYSFQGQARLAFDVGCSRSTISRLVGGHTHPSFALVEAVTAALEKSLGKPLDPRELFSPDGTYPTASGCALCGCAGCFPEDAYDGRGNLKPAFRNLRPGDWSLSPQHTSVAHTAETNHVRKEDR